MTDSNVARPNPLDPYDRPNPFGEPTDGDLLDDIENSTNFWNLKPQLQFIHQTARAEGRISPWGLLLATMAHRLSHVPPNVVLVRRSGKEGKGLAGGTSLNTFVAMVAPASGGKTATMSAAKELVPPLGGTVSDGTGQGIIKQFAETVKITKDEEGKPLDTPYLVTRFFRHSLTLHADEVKTLNAEFAREGSKTDSMLRSLWMGSDVGMINADRDRNVSIPANMARLCGIWGVQPHNATVIMSGAADGTPQRFLWVPSTECRRAADCPAVAPPPPGTEFTFPVFGKTAPGIAMGGSMPHEVRMDAELTDLPEPIWVHWSPQMTVDITAFQAEQDAMVNRFPYAKKTPAQQAEAERLVLEGHLLLTRIKLAASLGFLWGHAEPDDLDWYLSGVLLEVCVAEAAGVWQECQEHANKESKQRGHQRGIEQVEAQVVREAADEQRLAQWRDRVYTVLCQHGELTENSVRQKLSKAQGKVVRDLLRGLQDEGRAGYDGTCWFAIYQGHKLTKLRVVEG